jgi:hypothetical protein
LPDPATPDTIEIHGASVETLHEHPAGEETAIVVPVPPLAPIASCTGDTE